MGRSPSNDIDIPAQKYVSESSPDDVVIDVRTPGEFADGHLAGAPNVDFMAADFAERFEELDLDAATPVYLYCRSGNRSNRAAQLLRSRGFEKAYNIGGYESLVEAGAASERT